MIFAIASTRGPKVEAVKVVVSSIQTLLSPHDNDPVFLTREVDAGIDMPRSINDLLSGACRRVHLLQDVLARENRKADYLIGLEGGFHVVPSPAGDQSGMTFLQSWAYVSDGISGYFGSSGNIPVPAALATEVMEKNRDLGVVIDEFTQDSDIRSKQGTWGVLSGDLISRQQSFENALLNAFAPFYNREMYKRSETSGGVQKKK